MRSLLVATLLVGCGSVDEKPSEDASPTGDAAPDEMAGEDAGIDGPPANRCNPTAAFGAPVAVDSLNSASLEESLWLSADERTGFIASDRNGTFDVFSVSRPSLDEPFTVSPLAQVSTTEVPETRPFLHGDNLTLFLSKPPPNADYKIVVSRRATPASVFSTPASTTGIPSSSRGDTDMDLFMLPSGEAFFSMFRAIGTSSGSDLYTTTWDGTQFSAPSKLAAVNGDDSDFAPVVTPDRLTLYFASDRVGGPGKNDIYVATRTDTSLPFGTPAVVTPLVTAGNEKPTWLTADGCVMYIVRNGDIFAATRGQ